MWFHGPAYLVRNLVTPPHLPTYITHRAVPIKNLPSHDGAENGNSCFQGDSIAHAAKQAACGCAELTPNKVNEAAYNGAQNLDVASLSSESTQRFGPVNLNRLKDDGDARNPFLVVTAGNIIQGHDDIYNATLLSFVIELVGAVDQQKGREGR